ncbi:MAG: iron export ABC transporter permease subunit FetB [Candidatus Thiodiazotropha lotti]|uniref:Iron export ABC transporter permease subunit FetB n=1 Tax=Candidatus Thiodiazotropha endoloripes TaxID=1818881 RepID=A0A1E2UMG3_9GAMM|nr:iron export ABC transporter permease subunit FetB [Candidatus Thiodiazotropha endoloripes]MCG7900064.1 iron export ABC transporter permease subunit FetB [Candidatus Thiodiazotropha weberae]MCG7991783.1 iron export ABC transporter permease subunit FetB [Candidatus Thiodiazotropha lotti]MCG7903620.1 iron export ABC transporter permease subunit FetB [Candidatus Thiodiazotropha weberae]MCG7913084.1 iron export ABC transporter permease subunit FetB [Candidatus Thiodiazotropha weberae]MCG8000488.
MNLILLTPLDLAIAATLVVALALISLRLSLGIEGKLLIAALRTVIQLSLLGLVLKFLFVQSHPLLISALAMFMLFVAGYEVMARQQRRFSGIWGFGVGTLSMFISSFSVTILALTVIIQAEPWYSVQYLIPLLGMMLGNTMSGIAIALDNLTQNAWQRRQEIEARLILGHSWDQAIREIRRNALRSGLIPIINAMAAAGIVSLPGMMTGQILAGTPPMEASKYQILIMLLIAAGTGFGATAAVWIGAKRLFDDRERLRLDRLGKKRA